MNTKTQPGPLEVRLSDLLGLPPKRAAPDMPDAVQEALATLLESQFKLGVAAAVMGAHRMTPDVCRPAADVLRQTCAAIQQAITDQREQCAQVLRGMWDENAGRHDACFGPYHDGWTDALDLAERRIVLGPNVRANRATPARSNDD